MLAEILTCLVVSYYDPDTLHIDCGEGKESVRLSNVDSPERGWRADCLAEYLLEDVARHIILPNMLIDKEVEVEILYTDRYGRDVVNITLPDGRDYGQVLMDIRIGMEWLFDDYGNALTEKPNWCGPLDKELRKELDILPR